MGVQILLRSGEKNNSKFCRASFGPLSTNGGLTISLGTLPISHPTMCYVSSCEAGFEIGNLDE